MRRERAGSRHRIGGREWRTAAWAAPVLVLLSSLAAARPASAQAVVEVLGGGAWGAATPLTIHQDGEETLHLSARYETRALESPLYYAVRFGFGAPHRWEVQFVHHKLFLTNRPPEVYDFQITHGFNILTANRALELGGLRLRLGAGLVLAHTESTVRGKTLPSGGGIADSGYRATGPVLLLGVGEELVLSRRFFAAADVQLIAARFEVPIADGEASGSNIALHALVGLGYRF